MIIAHSSKIYAIKMKKKLSTCKNIKQYKNMFDTIKNEYDIKFLRMSIYNIVYNDNINDVNRHNQMRNYNFI